jgi:hypothetical protein
MACSSQEDADQSQIATKGQAISHVELFVVDDEAPSYPDDVNVHGVVVGTRYPDGLEGTRRAFEWADGVTTSLHPDGAADSRAEAITNSGWIGGSVDDEPVLWRPDKTVQRLGFPTGYPDPEERTFGYVRELNETRQAIVTIAVGESLPDYEDFFWSEETGYVDFDTEDYSVFAVRYLNERGQAILTVETVEGWESLFWDGGVTTPIEPVTRYSGCLNYDFNDLGQLTGLCANDFEDVVGFLWSDGVTTALDPTVLHAGYSLNNTGLIAGLRVNEDASADTFVWDGSEAVQIVGDGVSAIWPWFIDDAGVVVGEARVREVGDLVFVWNDEEQGLVLLPSLEPARGCNVVEANGAGMVIGNCGSAMGSTGVVWTYATAVPELDTDGDGLTD